MKEIILKKDFNVIKEEIINSDHPTCIICNSDKWVEYGDDKSGYVYCKECFDNYSCFHCKKMHISIYGKKITIRDLVGSYFFLFCDYCWQYKDVYADIELDTIEETESNYELNDDDLAEENELSSDDDINNHDLYHNTKGKYDLY